MPCFFLRSAFMVSVCTAGLILGSAGPLGRAFIMAGDAAVRFIRGDANVDGEVSLSDVFTILRYLSLGSNLKCMEAADVDDSGTIDQTDALFLLGSIFYRHGPPPPPFQKSGEDPTPDPLGCREGVFVRGEGDLGPLGKNALGQEDALPGTDCDGDDGGADLEFIHFRGPILTSPGDPALRVPILYRSGGGVEGFTLSLAAPIQWIRLENIEFDGTVLDALKSQPQWMHLFTGKRVAGFLSASVALSIAAPFQTLPDLHDETLAYLVFSVLPDTPVGTKLGITFEDTPGEKGLPPIRNEVSRRGAAQPRHLCGLTVEIVSGDDVFVRGDANRDRVLNLGDVVRILQHLFPTDSFPVDLPCPDAADVDDNGRIAVTDAIALLNYLFLRGADPPSPFPEAGRDSPSPDNLGCANPR